MHAVTGLPRSGSTLLCNILAQNPDFHVSSTSPVAQMLVAMATGMPTQPEVTSELLNGDAERPARAMRGLVRGWYLREDKKVIFDKSRLWAAQAPMLRALWEKSVVLCTVRDPRQVFASIEARHRKTAHLQPGPQGTMANRAALMMQPDGLIGSAIVGVEDLLRNRDEDDNLIIIDYDELCTKPEKILSKVYQRLELPAFEHDFDDIENQATDADALYCFKYPHDGSGKVEARAPYKLPADIGNHIIRQFPYYSGELRYTA